MRVSTQLQLQLRYYRMLACISCSFLCTSPFWKYHSPAVWTVDGGKEGDDVGDIPPLPTISIYMSKAVFPSPPNMWVSAVLWGTLCGRIHRAFYISTLLSSERPSQHNGSGNLSKHQQGVQLPRLRILSRTESWLPCRSPFSESSPQDT